MAKKAKAIEPVEEPRIEYVRLPDIARAKRNPKGHATSTIVASIRRHGFVSPLVENAKTGRLVAGHGRLEAVEAIKAETPDQPPARVKVGADGEWMLPVLRGVSFPSEQRAEEFLLADNRLVELGGWDDAALAPMLGEIAARGQAAIAALGWQSEEIAALVSAIPGALPPDADPGPQPPPKVPTSRLGDLWILGDHRLLCGSSSNEKDVARLMDGQRAVLMATDPPYGVNYTDSARVAVANMVDGGSRKQNWKVAIDSDEKTGENIQPFLEEIFKLAVSVAIEKNAAWYLWHAHMTQGFFAAAAAAADLLLHRQIIWVKPSLLLGFGDYHWRHELCFYGWIKGNRPEFYGERNQTTVWEFGNETSPVNRVHPTQKPVEIFAIPMRNHTKPNEVCYEPFSGSGTQIVAGEKLGRRVFAMEIDPRYVDAAVARWEGLTGKKAVLQKGARKPKAAPKKATKSNGVAPVATPAPEATVAA